MSVAQGEKLAIYPPADAVAAAEGKAPCARILQVLEDSPAYDAGFEPGCLIARVNGQPLRDIIDWRWQSADDIVVLDYIDLDGEAGSVELERDFGQDWGIVFDGLLFEPIKLCRNACTFCFMRQMPEGLRPSLTLRDDDFRLSFLSGTFVTMTNITPEDEARIIEQRISPLRVSLHAVSEPVRKKLMGKHAAHGLAVIERLLDAGIHMHAQIVLVPGQNDASVLEETLNWAYERPGIVQIGVVPLGYTRYQSVFDVSFNDSRAAHAVLDLLQAFQRKALGERGHAWVYAADEFYRNAYGEKLLDELPDADFYGDFGMFEDGVGIIRSYVDDFNDALESGLAQRCATALQHAGQQAYMLVGYAMLPFLDQLIEESPLKGHLQVLAVENRFFGGNVDVTGLLVGSDIAAAVRALDAPVREKALFLVPEVVLNDDELLLDDSTLEQVSRNAGAPIHAVSCNPTGFLVELLDMLAL